MIGCGGGFGERTRERTIERWRRGERERGGSGQMEDALANWIWFGLNVVLVWHEQEREGFGRKRVKCVMWHG